jgi:ATP-binding cassette subfamily B protein
MLFTDLATGPGQLGDHPATLLRPGVLAALARQSFMRIRRAIAMVNGEHNQNITGVRVVQSLNRQQENLKHFNGLNQEFLDANLEATRFSGTLQPIVECLTGVGMGVGVVLVGGILLQRGQIEWGCWSLLPCGCSVSSSRSAS